MQEPQKPTNVAINEEIEILKSNIVNSVQSCRLQIPIVKLVLQQITNDLNYAFDRQVDSERNQYYAALSEYQAQIEKAKTETHEPENH